jgi:hypothetical protein
MAKAPLPEQAEPQQGEGEEAVDQFDQQGEQTDPEADKPLGDTSPTGEGTGDSQSVALMEQWLQQIEGSPAYLLRNQFRREEQRSLISTGRPLHEPRPW